MLVRYAGVEIVCQGGDELRTAVDVLTTRVGTVISDCDAASPVKVREVTPLSRAIELCSKAEGITLAAAKKRMSKRPRIRNRYLRQVEAQCD